MIGDQAEQAYRRGDALEKRRALMEAWAQWCEPTRSAAIQLRLVEVHGICRWRCFLKKTCKLDLKILSGKISSGERSERYGSEGVAVVR